ncbi:MAG: response regulator [Flavobacterium sp.]|nr:MAG: response regulator [Flavobacterium sp.]
MPFKKILLIDDDTDDTLIFMEALQELDKDVECHTALNPLKAFQELASAEDLPDLIFLDYNMPLVNGLEFIQRMQGVERLKKIEVIVISTPPEDVMVQWFARNNTPVRYISKPNTIRELKEILKKLL